MLTDLQIKTFPRSVNNTDSGTESEQSFLYSNRTFQLKTPSPAFLKPSVIFSMEFGAVSQTETS